MDSVNVDAWKKPLSKSLQIIITLIEASVLIFLQSGGLKIASIAGVSTQNLIHQLSVYDPSVSAVCWIPPASNLPVSLFDIVTSDCETEFSSSHQSED